MEKLLKRLTVLALATGVSSTVFLIAILVWHSSQSQYSGATTTVAEPAPTDKTPEERGTPAETNWETAKRWGVKFFRWPIGILTVLVGLATGILLYRRELVTLKRLGTIFLVAVVISLLATFGHKAYKWWLSRPETIAPVTHAARAETAVKPSASRSLVTTKTIVARPDEWSEFIWIPPNHKYSGESTDCVEIKNGLGAIFNYCPGDKLTLSKNGTPPEGQLTFRSLTGCNVEVYVEWEPK
ncbi:MAG: hypothetical protein HYT46_01820 [Candidatus Vogelbacteria bacterium]|nr:hypothetical protein [Candidatus Vogelbacteria bacterium]